jgi:type II secretory pathway pseudopilin PulG
MRRSPGGFTLVELLILVAVIAVMMALIVPALQRARDVAKRRVPPEQAPKARSVVDRAFQAVDSTFASLPPAKVAFNPRRQMRWKQPERVDALVSASMDGEQLTAELRHRMATDDPAVVEGIRIAPQMELHLTGDAFKIDRITPERQPVGRSGAVEWSWSVTPLEAGTQKLYLSVDAVVSIRGQDATRAIRVLEQPIEVQITNVETVESFVEANWQWIAGTILIPLVVWAWNRKKRSGSPDVNV